MPIVSSKRQITLPIYQCREADIGPGDEYVSYVDNLGRITVIKKHMGAARGVMAHIKADASVSEEESLRSGLAT